MADALMTITRRGTLEEAYAVKALLEENGVFAVVDEENVRTVFWGIPGVFGGVRILVRTADGGKARSLLRNWGGVRRGAPPATGSGKGGRKSSRLWPWRLLKAFPLWLVNPKALAGAVRHYGPTVVIAAGVFVLSALAGVVFEPDFMKQQWDEIYIAVTAEPRYDSTFVIQVDWSKLEEQMERALEQHAADLPESWRDASMERKPRAAPEPQPESVKQEKFLMALGIGAVFWAAYFSLLSIVLGAVLGLYPLYGAVVSGLWLGFFFRRMGPEGVFEEWTGWGIALPLMLSVYTVIVGSAAIGLHLGTFIVRKHKGSWYKQNVWHGMTTWARVILPVLILGVVCQLGVFYLLAVLA